VVEFSGDIYVQDEADAVLIGQKASWGVRAAGF
jgi:hypothetical protein